MNNKSAEIRASISKGIVIFALSLLLFANVDINFRLYAAVLILLSILVPINFWKNRSKIYPKATLFVTANLAAYGAIFHFMRRDLYSIAPIDILLNILCIVIPLGLFIMGKGKASEPTSQPTLFQEQKYDLQRIEHSVKSFEITGINGAWGTGKTFLVKHFVENNADKYAFIRVDLLSCNLDEIQGLLIDEMEKILLSNRVYSKYSKKLKQMMDKGDIFAKLPNVLVDDTATYATALEEFKGELKLVGKPVVIIYEDIDRIASIEVIKKIFSISEQLAGDWIKIVYQYDQSNLDDMELERTFTEKYIPHVLNITEIGFRDMLSFLYDVCEIDTNLINKEDFNKLAYEMDMREIRGFDFHSARYAVDLPFSNVTIRGVKNFLLELQSALSGDNGEEYCKKGNKETVFAFFFAKHFLYEIYAQLRMNKSVIETFLFELKGNSYKYTITELYLNLKQKNDILNICGEGPNALSYWVICNLFGYNPHAKEQPLPFNYEESASEPITTIHIRDRNDKKDRLIWNLLCNGTSEYTDYENLRNRMVGEVLNEPDDEQSAAFDLLYNEMFSGVAGKSGNTNVQKIGGVRFFAELFRAFSLTPNSEDIWHKVIAFYFRYENVTYIDQKLVEVLNYGGIDKKNVYIDILRRFNGLKVIGDLSGHKTYHVFLYNYVGALNRLGYIYTHSVELLQNVDFSKHKSELVEIIQVIENDVGELESIEIDAVLDELNVIKAFLTKNLEIIERPNPIKFSQPGIKTEFSSHQTEEFKRLLSFPRDDTVKFLNEIEMSYKAGKITVREILQIQGSSPKQASVDDSCE